MGGARIEHDGKGCPCVGQVVDALHEGPPGNFHIDTAVATGGMSWDWRYYGPFSRITRYRIRKPKGMAILNAILREVERTPELV